MPDGAAFDLPVKLTPNARHNHIGPLECGPGHQYTLKVAVTAVPEKGKAFAAMIKLLAKSLKIAKGDIDLIAGQTSRNKKLCIRGDEAVLISRLKQLTEKGK